MALPPLIDSGITSDDMVPTEASVEVPVEAQAEMFPNGAEVMPDGEGGAIVQALQEMMMSAEQEEQVPHNANLAEYLDDGYLGEISSDLRASFDDDMESRSEWEETYTKGLDQLGVKYQERTVPFEGASGVTHPLIAESVTQFQAQAYKELLPSGGPVKTQVLGLQDAQIWISFCSIYRYRVLPLRRCTLTKLNSGRCPSLSLLKIWLYLMRPLIWLRRLVLLMFFGWMLTKYARCRLLVSTVR
jgi:hypothetical protein